MLLSFVTCIFTTKIIHLGSFVESQTSEFRVLKICHFFQELKVFSFITILDQKKGKIVHINTNVFQFFNSSSVSRNNNEVLILVKASLD